MMPKSYRRDGIFNPHLTAIEDSYSTKCAVKIANHVNPDPASSSGTFRVPFQYSGLSLELSDMEKFSNNQEEVLSLI